MKFVFKWLARKMRNSLEDEPQLEKASNRLVAISEDSLNSRGMNFTVYKASGGFVIEHRVYDRKTDRNNNSLHIITDDKDLGEEIGKIITFESLRS